MKALQIIEAGNIKVTDINKPTPAAGEILLRVRYVGFCGSDLNTFLGKNPMVKMPVVPGHEICASIEQICQGVPAGFQLGMRVTVNPYTNCGTCASCRNGRVTACEFNQTLGVQRNGSMQEYIALPWQKIIPAADLSQKECALIEPMSVGFHAVSRAQVTDIDTVAVIGCGMIGLGAIVRASLRGARVIALDIDDEKLSLAKRLGAKEGINSKSENVIERVKALTDGLMADVVIEAVGSPITYTTAIDIVGFTGRVVCIGYAKSEVSFQTKYFVQKELDIRGSRNAMPEDFRAVIQYLQNGTCPKDELISAEITPEEAEETLKQWDENPGKVFRILVEF